MPQLVDPDTHQSFALSATHRRFYNNLGSQSHVLDSESRYRNAWQLLCRASQNIFKEAERVHGNVGTWDGVVTTAFRLRAKIDSIYGEIRSFLASDAGGFRAIQRQARGQLEATAHVRTESATPAIFDLTSIMRDRERLGIGGPDSRLDPPRRRATRDDQDDAARDYMLTCDACGNVGHVPNKEAARHMCTATEDQTSTRPFKRLRVFREQNPGQYPPASSDIPTPARPHGA